jgi:predicted negative regulator of RcsB-dependent stress response
VAKPDSRQATETLHELDSALERAAHWATTHPRAVLVVIGVVLAVAAAVGGHRAWSASREADASAAIAAVQADYLTAMGAPPGALEVPEPANAEAAAATRREFAARLREAAEQHDGTAAAVTAWLQAAKLLEELGEPEEALAAARSAVEAASGDDTLEALARTRLAARLEAGGDAAGAAAEYLAAGRTNDFPGRVLALGNAARAFADAGDTERALEVFGSLEDDEIAQLPAHVSARLAELRVRTQAAAPPAPAPEPAAEAGR